MGQWSFSCNGQVDLETQGMSARPSFDNEGGTPKVDSSFVQCGSTGKKKEKKKESCIGQNIFLYVH